MATFAVLCPFLCLSISYFSCISGIALIKGYTFSRSIHWRFFLRFLFNGPWCILLALADTRGARPAYAHNLLNEAKRDISIISVLIKAAEKSAIPGILIKLTIW